MVESKVNDGVFSIATQRRERTGIQIFPVPRGTHTIKADFRTIRELAIADFVGELLSRSKHQSAAAKDEAIALAVGYFDVPLSMLKSSSDELSLSDAALGLVVRYRISKEREEHGEQGIQSG